MSLPRLWNQESDPFRAMRREMENVFRAFDQSLPSPVPIDIGKNTERQDSAGRIPVFLVFHVVGGIFTGT